ncbi:MAG: hypothetical protein H6582_11630 [Crocinitomicaceae bacterium]|nr:hypothetical protein [Crocinitomicaceae bacterium]
MSENENKYQIPAWLKELQENSWNLELLISGGAIFTLFQLEDIFVDFMMRLKMTAHLPGTGIFIILGMLALKMLTLGFLSHLLLRTYWLGLLCVNYVFPKGVSNKVKSYPNPYRNKYGEGKSLQDEIHRVDNISGLVMYISVLTTMVILGFVILTTVILSVPSLLADLPDWYFSLTIWLIMIYHFDLFLFGLFRRIPYLSYITFPIFWLFDRLSLRVFYDSSLALFSSNVSKLKTFIGMLVVILIGVIFTYNAIYKVMHWPYLLDSREHRWSMASNEQWIYPSFYRDSPENENEKIYGPSIQSDIINENYIDLIVPYDVDFDDNLTDDQYLEEDVLIFIDDSLYQVEWFNYRPKENDQLGMKSVIGIDHLNSGKHDLVVRSLANEEMEQKIPFWKN